MTINAPLAITTTTLADWTQNQAGYNQTVVTTGGIIGKVTKATDGEDLEVDIAPGVKVKLVRGMITDVRSKGAPVNDNKAA